MRRARSADLSPRQKGDPFDRPVRGSDNLRARTVQVVSSFIPRALLLAP
jgi:hypothetical protein